jgi:hypothetical protein
MIDEFAKEYLHDDLRWIREAMLWKLDGLSEYDVRRPLTPTGTNLLGLIKHLTTSEAWYFGEIFGRPFAEPVPRWDGDEAALSANMWAAEDETRAEIIGRYRRVRRGRNLIQARMAMATSSHGENRKCRAKPRTLTTMRPMMTTAAMRTIRAMAGM